MKNLNYLNSRFQYKGDGQTDRWTLMEADEKGYLKGDCDDYALWVAFYLVAGGSWLKLYWLVLTRQLKFHYVRVTSSWEPHMVLEYKGRFIDNWHRKWVAKNVVNDVFTFKHRAILPVIWFKQLANLWS